MPLYIYFLSSKDRYVSVAAYSGKHPDVSRLPRTCRMAYPSAIKIKKADHHEGGLPQTQLKYSRINSTSNRTPGTPTNAMIANIVPITGLMR
jgi:hypothetical protein